MGDSCQFDYGDMVNVRYGSCVYYACYPFYLRLVNVTGGRYFVPPLNAFAKYAQCEIYAAQTVSWQWGWATLAEIAHTRILRLSLPIAPSYSNRRLVSRSTTKTSSRRRAPRSLTWRTGCARPLRRSSLCPLHRHRLLSPLFSSHWPVHTSGTRTTSGVCCLRMVLARYSTVAPLRMACNDNLLLTPRCRHKNKSKFFSFLA